MRRRTVAIRDSVRVRGAAGVPAAEVELGPRRTLRFTTAAPVPLGTLALDAQGRGAAAWQRTISGLGDWRVVVAALE